MDLDPRATTLDMTLDGGFRPAARPGFGLGAAGLTLLAAVAGGIVLGLALALWLAVTVLPVMIGVALVLYVFARVRNGARRRPGAMRVFTLRSR